MSLSKHTAPGQMAGYLFQPERALYWLARSERGGVVGIETTDDVVLKAKDGSITQEQDKSTLKKGHNPLSDGSKDLWKTLSIWCQALKASEIEIKSTTLVIATTADIPPCLAKDIGAESKTPVQINEYVARLRKAGKTPGATIAPYVTEVSKCTDSELAELISRVRLIDASDSSSGDSLKQTLCSELHIPDDFPEDEIIDSLYGWLCHILLSLWREGKPGWITHEQFARQLSSVLRRQERRAFRERAKDLIVVTDEERKSHKTYTFVKQLILVTPDDDEDTLVSAIDDFIRALNERNRLTQRGNITREDLEAFETRLHDRWKVLHKRTKARFKTKTDEELARSLGFELLLDTLDHREGLAGQATEEYYLTRGSYHRLADQILLGWHPDYDSKLGGKNKP